MTTALPDSRQIGAVVSDVDGTLVTDSKQLTERAQAAVAELHARGIQFTIISSRPPRGMSMLPAPLNLLAPLAAFNGGIIATPDMTVIAEHLISADVAQRTLQLFEARGVETWVFTGQNWFVREDRSALVSFEQRTIGFAAELVTDLAPLLASAAKIVGASEDYELLARCEQELVGEFAGRATVARSQLYYLDVTHLFANKGAALTALAKLMAVPTAEIAVIGDGRNDMAMFATSGLSIAMGNASAEVKAAADLVTASNEQEGFATAIEQLVLPRIATPSPGQHRG
jgi:Cof subfamily protein (haloacid dehalogenase superfamily)